jgi:hypothetical protein
MNPYLLLLMEQPAIQNLEFLRQLIRETREQPQADAERLRMIYGTNTGTDNLSVRRGDE